MTNGVTSAARASAAPRPASRDALGAVALAELAISDRVLVALDAGAVFDVAGVNAFDRPVKVEKDRDEAGAVIRLARVVAEAAAAGERVALVASASTLAAARAELADIASRRLGAVVHAVARVAADAVPLLDLGWGVLVAASVEESLDLTLVARRAAEDSGTPFLVVHERGTVRHTEPLAALTTELAEAFVGAPASRLRKVSDPAHPVHASVAERAFAERVPFALGSAMRELEALTGRHHDAIERRPPAGDAQIALVGVGALGDSLLGAVERLRAAGHDVAAVRVTALRPFPGPKLVKTLCRALAVSVVESADQPLAQSNPLTRELKAAFSDALTWAPDYPGIGRIPRIHSGVADVAQLEATDLEAMAHNMLADERGRRTFVLGADPLGLLEGVPKVEHHEHEPSRFTMRARVADERAAHACVELCPAVIGALLGLRARAAVRALAPAEGGGFAVDVIASRERPRGAHAPASVKLIALDDARALIDGSPLARLAKGGVLAVPTASASPAALWAEIPPYVKAIVFDRAAKVVGWSAGSAEEARSPWTVAGAFSGVAVATASSLGRGAVDASLVAREVSEAVLAAVSANDPHRAEVARGASETARRAFEAHVEVPRSLVEKDEDAIRLGRKDARAAAALAPR